MRTVAIIGGGCSGVALAAHLARFEPGVIHATVIDDSERPGLGVAYGTTRSEHLLNVPAGRMSLFPDDPDHLLRWLRESGHEHAPTDFIPRPLYGAYLRSRLDHAIRAGVVSVRRARCTNLRRDADVTTLTLNDGSRLRADIAVLALGNGTPAPLRVTSRNSNQHAHRRIIQNPWAELSQDRIDPSSRVVLVGTGLTAIDMILTLDAIGHQGPIAAISRRGLLPRSHAPAAPRATEFSPSRLVLHRSPRSALRAVREACEQEIAAGGSWRTVIDALRPHTAEAWQAWSAEERRAFSRFLRPYWDVHRHRMAPSIAERIGAHLASGRVTIHRTGLAAIEASDTGVAITTAQAGASAPIRADILINCTGPSTDPSRWRDPLVDHLLNAGLARVDALGLGFDTDDDGRLHDQSGQPSATLFAIGPLRRPHLWESIAVPEIRAQAAALSNIISTMDPSANAAPHPARNAPAR